jgi:hypothetical protein
MRRRMLSQKFQKFALFGLINAVLVAMVGDIMMARAGNMDLAIIDRFHDASPYEIKRENSAPVH